MKLKIFRNYNYLVLFVVFEIYKLLLLTDSFTTFDCQFESSFLCGYETLSMSNAKWSQHRNGLLTVKQNPLQDSSGSFLGTYIYI